MSLTTGDAISGTPVKIEQGRQLSRGEEVAQALEALAHENPEGHRLGTKDELRKQFGVSVGSFNEATRVLVSRGVVRLRTGPNGGVFVATPSMSVRIGNLVLELDGEHATVARAARMRDALDPLLIEDALWHASRSDILEMRDLVGKMHEQADQGNARGYLRDTWRLHARIAKVSPNRTLSSVYLSLLEFIEIHTQGVVSGETKDREYLLDRAQLHGDIVDAIALNDRESAERLAHEHATTERWGQTPT